MRPAWMIGKSPAVMTAKIVMASAAREIEVRPRPRGEARRKREPHQAHPGEVRVAGHADGADDVAVDVGPGGIRGPSLEAHALWPFAGGSPDSRTTFLRA